MAAVYLVQVAHTGVPDARISAPDLVVLGERIAAHLARHKAIRPGPYDALVGDEAGAITQPLLQRPIHFTIRKDA